MHRTIIRGDLTGDADATGAVAEAMLEAGGWFTLTATVDTWALRREVGLSLSTSPRGRGLHEDLGVGR